MRIKVEIGEDVQEFTYDRKAIFVGSDTRCQLSLAYEEIAPKHLKVVSKDSKVYIQDLKSGQKTFYNDTLVKPGSIIEFNTFFPIEIGGIFIYLLDEVSPISKADISLDSTVSELIDDEIPAPKIKILDTEKAPQKSSVPNEFKRDLFAESSQSESFSESEITTTQKPSRNKTGTTKVSTKINIKNRQKRNERDKLKRNNNILKSSNIRALVILFAGICVWSLIYYVKYYKPQMSTLTKTPVKLNPVKVILSDDKMKVFEDRYTLALQNESCTLPSVEKICLTIKQLFPLFKGQHITIVGKILFIGLEEESLLPELKDLNDYTSEEVNRLRSTIDDSYSNIVEWDRFEAANYVSDEPSLIFAHRKYIRVLALIKVLLSDSSLAKNSSNFDNVHFFVKNSIGFGEYQISDYLVIEPSIYEFKKQNIAENKFILKTITKSKLTNSALDFISSFGDSVFSDFSSKDYDKFKKDKAYEKFLIYLTESKCTDEFEQEVCSKNTLSTDSEFYEGALVRDSRLYIITRIDSIETLFEKYKNYEYEAKDKKIISRLFKKNSIEDQSFEDFYESGFVANNKTEILYKNFLLANHIASDFGDLISTNKMIKEIVLIGAGTNEDQKPFIQEVVSFESTRENELQLQKLKDSLVYIYKSRLNIFHNFKMKEF